jgi:flagellar hook assembly protein FlgD
MDRKITAGQHALHWGGANADGRRVASGIYFMKLETRKGSLVKKMVISR